MSNAASSPIVVDARPSASLVSWTQVIYALHAVSLVTGILGAASVVGAFLIGWPSIIAVVMNYVKRGEARGTWLDSHFRWQLRTFWFGLLWAVLCLAFVVLTLGIGLVIVWIPLGVLTLWFIYRIARGWSALCVEPADVHVARATAARERLRDGIGDQRQPGAVVRDPAPLDVEPGLAEQPPHVRFVALDQPPVGQVLDPGAEHLDEPAAALETIEALAREGQGIRVGLRGQRREDRAPLQAHLVAVLLRGVGQGNMTSSMEADSHEKGTRAHPQPAPS